MQILHRAAREDTWADRTNGQMWTQWDENGRKPASPFSTAGTEPAILESVRQAGQAGPIILQMTPQLQMDPNEARLGKLARVAADLHEEFGSIRILATFHDELKNETHAYTVSAGNRYASEMQVREWVESCDETVQQTVDEDDE